MLAILYKKNNQEKKAQPRKDSSKYQAILQSTRELVDENGYRSLTIKAVAGRAGVSRSVIYNWWQGDLQQLIEEAILPDVTAWKVPDTGSLKGDLSAFIDVSIDAMHRPNVLGGYLELASHVVSNPEDLDRTSKKFRAPYARLLGKILQKAEERGELAKHDPSHSIHYAVLAQMISGCVLQFSITKKPGRRKAKDLLLTSVLKLIS